MFYACPKCSFKKINHQEMIRLFVRCPNCKTTLISDKFGWFVLPFLLFLYLSFLLVLLGELFNSLIFSLGVICQIIIGWACLLMYKKKTEFLVIYRRRSFYELGFVLSIIPVLMVLSKFYTH